MSDDEADPELLALLAKSLGLTDSNSKRSPVITVLKDAEYIYDNSTDIAIDMRGTKAAAGHIWSSIQDKGYSTRDWSKHELHPKTKDESTVNFIFLMDLLNFSFWPNSEDPKEGFAIEYLGKRRTGYWSLVACIQRALDHGVPITDPSYWVNESECTDDVLKRVFKSDTTVEIPLLEDRLYCVREAGYVLRDRFGGSFINCILDAAGSAASLVNILVDYFPCFDDRHRFEGQIVCLHKRPQILVADLWACFEGEGYGSFSDVDQITMFADYRIPQMLHTLSCLSFSPPLDSHIRQRKIIESGHHWEIQLRGCSIWCVELIRRAIKRAHPETHINAILIDFFLYDTMKEMEANGVQSIPHHRTRSIWY